MRLTVTALLVVGATAAPGLPMFFSASDSESWPESLKIVGQGDVVVHGGGVVRFTTTSESSTEEKVPAPWPPPGAAVNELMTSITGDRPERTTSPHDVAVPTSTANASRRVIIRIQVTVRLSSSGCAA